MARSATSAWTSRKRRVTRRGVRPARAARLTGRQPLPRVGAQVAKQFEALREEWWTTVDAGRTQDEVAADVAAAAQAALARARSGAPLRRLW